MNISIILVRPRNPQNIGAAARAMANFGLGDLRVVAPFPPVWEEVVSAVGAQDIIKKAKVFSTLPEALHDAAFVMATTALRNRKTVRRVIPLPQLAAALEERQSSKTAIIFGPEKTGLTKEDIALADAVLNIPTAAKTPSINLAQAVTLCCYEISKNKIPAGKSTPRKEAVFEEKQLVIKNLENLLKKLDLPPTLNSRIRGERLLNISAESHISKENIFFLNSLIDKINKKLGS